MTNYLLNKSNLSNLKVSKAFTLAEILIVLGIIGIVASITIPILISNIQEQILKTAWKKEFSMLSQVAMNIANDNGGTLKYAFDSPKDVFQKFAKYIKILKPCYDVNEVENGCWADPTYFSNGDKIDPIGGGGYSMVLMDGAFLNIRTSTDDCSQSAVILYNRNSVAGGSNYPNNCLSMLVDVNGAKPPNKIGFDILGLIFTENSAKPYSAELPMASATTNFSNAEKYLSN